MQYPNAGAASAGLAALEGDQARPEQNRRVSGLVVADARGNLLGAVLGEIDEAVADALLARALGRQVAMKSPQGAPLRR